MVMLGQNVNKRSVLANSQKKYIKDKMTHNCLVSDKGFGTLDFLRYPRMNPTVQTHKEFQFQNCRWVIQKKKKKIVAGLYLSLLYFRAGRPDLEF